MAELERFHAYRESIYRPLPFNLAAVVVWLQNGWQTLGMAFLARFYAHHAYDVWILGNDTRIWDDRAPALKEMAMAVPGTLIPAMNTKEQALAFWERAKDGNYLIITAASHVVRASLTFERWRTNNESVLSWAWEPWTTNPDAEQAEVSKIHEYAAKGDCLPL